MPAPDFQADLERLAEVRRKIVAMGQMQADAAHCRSLLADFTPEQLSGKVELLASMLVIARHCADHYAALSQILAEQNEECLRLLTASIRSN